MGPLEIVKLGSSSESRTGTFHPARTLGTREEHYSTASSRHEGWWNGGCGLWCGVRLAEVKDKSLIEGKVLQLPLLCEPQWLLWLLWDA
eukprot:1727944-Amphidinium_carterae.1